MSIRRRCVFVLWDGEKFCAALSFLHSSAISDQIRRNDCYGAKRNEQLHSEQAHRIIEIDWCRPFCGRPCREQHPSGHRHTGRELPFAAHCPEVRFANAESEINVLFHIKELSALKAGLIISGGVMSAISLRSGGRCKAFKDLHFAVDVGRPERHKVIKLKEIKGRGILWQGDGRDR